jgi:hypothetical protein
VSLCQKGFNARWLHVYINHFINLLSLCYFWEVWHEWLHLNFDDIPLLSPDCLSLSSLFWRFVFHPNTNQVWLCLASETRWDRMRSGWYGQRLKIFLDWSLSFLIVRICSFLDFVWFWSHVRGEITSRSSGSQYQRDIFGLNLSNKEA